MKKGRKPKPAELRKLEGNRGRRPIPETPGFAIGTTPPDTLDRRAKNEWRRLYPDLVEAGILTKADRAAFAAYCSAWSRYQQAEAEIAKYVQQHGTNTYRTRSGVWKTIPQVETARKEREDLRRWASELGLTPSARTRVAVQTDSEKTNPLFEFLSGGSPKGYDDKGEPTN